MTATRRPILSLLAMWAAALICASAAGAQGTPIEVLQEGPSSEGCAPCALHLVGESHIVALPSGVVVSSCQDEIEGTINQNGTGEVTWTGTADEAPGCMVSNCTASGEEHWPLSSLLEAAGETRVTMRVCYRAVTTEIHCDLVLTTPEPTEHNQTFSAEDLCLSNTRRVEGTWQTESDTHDSLEIVHGGGSAVEVFREVSDPEPCEPCDIHLTGETRIIAQPSGVELSRCQDELEGTITQHGTGELAWTGTAHDPVGPGCNVINCTVDGEEHWPLVLPVEVNGDARVTLRVCYQALSGTARVHCDIVLTIPETPAHDQAVAADQLCASNIRQVVIGWATESTAHDSLEIVHSDS